MAYLTAAVAVVGALCLLNLIMVFGIIRRLREHGQQLSQATPGLGPAGGVPVGQQVGDFAATTTTTAGEQVSREQLTAPTLIGFFTRMRAVCRAAAALRPAGTGAAG